MSLCFGLSATRVEMWSRADQSTPNPHARLNPVSNQTSTWYLDRQMPEQKPSDISGTDPLIAEKKDPPLGDYSESCAFCTIARAFPPSATLSPPIPSPNDDPVIFPQAHIIISTDSVLAFLDIQPLTRGHVLVCPRNHVERVTDMTPTESCRVGAWLPVIARAVMKTAGVTDFNVVQNNGICPVRTLGERNRRGLIQRYM